MSSKSIEEFKENFNTIKLIPCLKVNEDIMSGIEKEVKEIIEKNQASEVITNTHVTNWTKPYGEALQFSLYNATGDTNDFSTDHNHSQKDNKNEKDKFFFNKNYINIYKIFKIFEKSILNLRLNGMGNKSGLSPHKEYNIIGNKIKLRFHLPVITNNSANAMLDNEIFHLERGIIYFFNNGCIHDAKNDGMEPRYHLVWDVWLNNEIYEKILNVENSKNEFTLVSKIPKETISELLISKPYNLKQYEDERLGHQKYIPELEKIRWKISNLYRTILKREPDNEGLELWSNKLLKKELDFEKIRKEFFDSEEFNRIKNN